MSKKVGWDKSTGKLCSPKNSRRDINDFYTTYGNAPRVVPTRRCIVISKSDQAHAVNQPNLSHFFSRPGYCV
jgi:hypothetical protein